MPSFTPTAHVWGCTDTLAAAAAGVMMTVDANAGVEVGQRGSCVASIAVAAALPGCESLAEDKESNAGDAAPRYPEDAALDLSKFERPVTASQVTISPALQLC